MINKFNVILFSLGILFPISYTKGNFINWKIQEIGDEDNHSHCHTNLCYLNMYGRVSREIDNEGLFTSVTNLQDHLSYNLGRDVTFTINNEMDNDDYHIVIFKNCRKFNGNLFHMETFDYRLSNDNFTHEFILNPRFVYLFTHERKDFPDSYISRMIQRLSYTFYCSNDSSVLKANVEYRDSLRVVSRIWCVIIFGWNDNEVCASKILAGDFDMNFRNRINDFIDNI